MACRPALRQAEYGMPSGPGAELLLNLTASSTWWNYTFHVSLSSMSE